MSKKQEEYTNPENKPFIEYLISQIEQGIIKSPVSIEKLKQIKTFTLEERYVTSNGNKYGPYYSIRFSISGRLLTITLKSDPREKFPKVFQSKKAS